MIIAIDTSTSRASVAAYDTELLAEYNWVSHGQQTRELLPALDFMLKGLAVDWEQVTGVAVAQGPGSFNGLRVGMSTAKGLALARGFPIVGVPTLDVIAYQFRLYPYLVCAVLRAGRGRIATATYSTENGEIRRLTDYRNTTVAQLVEGLDMPALIAGEITPEMAEEIQGSLGSEAALSIGAAAWHRAGYLAEMAAARVAQGEADDLASLQPIYLSVPTMGKGCVNDR